MQTKNYNVKIENIELIDMRLHRVKEFNMHEFNFTLSAQTIINHSAKTIVLFLKNEVKSKPENDPLAEITIAVGFIVENFDEEFIKDGEKLNEINTDLEKHFRSISISTLRGIMFSEFKGTRLHAAILPIILPDDLKPAPEKKIV